MIRSSIIEALESLQHTLRVIMEEGDYVQIDGAESSFIQIKKEPEGFMIDVWSSDESDAPAQTMTVLNADYLVEEE